MTCLIIVVFFSHDLKYVYEHEYDPVYGRDFESDFQYDSKRDLNIILSKIFKIVSISILSMNSGRNNIPISTKAIRRL